MSDQTDAPPTQANNLRGEVGIELEGEYFVLRPSHTAIYEIEKQTGKTKVQLVIAAENWALSLADCAIVVGEMIRHWGGPPTMRWEIK